MIEIISGVYGAHDGLKKAGDAPFSLSAEGENRLVERGVARYTYAPAPDVPRTPVATPPVGDDGGNKGDDTPDAGNGAEREKQGGIDGGATDGGGDSRSNEEDGDERPALPVYSVDMKADQLRALMEQFKILFKVGMTKANMVAALDEHFASDNEDGDTPPELDAEEPVT